MLRKKKIEWEFDSGHWVGSVFVLSPVEGNAWLEYASPRWFNTEEKARQYVLDNVEDAKQMGFTSDYIKTIVYFEGV